MKLVVIESPYAGDTRENVKYAQAALKDSLIRGEAPIASHLLHTQVLDDDSPEDRTRGIDAGTAWIPSADLLAVYTDRGISLGMAKAIELAAKADVRVEYRALNLSPEVPAFEGQTCEHKEWVQETLKG